MFSNARIDNVTVILPEQIGKEARMEAGEHHAHGFYREVLKKALSYRTTEMR
jgi:hypothetical protein